MRRWSSRRRPATAFLGLGSNLGDRLATLRSALEDLEDHRVVHVEAVSAVYQSAPWSGDQSAPWSGDQSAPWSGDQSAPWSGDQSAPWSGDEPVPSTAGRPGSQPLEDVEQGPYLNLVAGVSTRLTPRRLLELGHRIERAHGRDRARERRWGPRTLDIDLLLYDHLVIDEPGLTVPHPRLTQRAFVLVPLAEVAPPGATLPDGSTIPQHLARLAPIEGIELYVRLQEGPGSASEPLRRRPAGPRGGPPQLRPPRQQR